MIPNHIPPKQTENEEEEDKRIIAKKDNTNHKPKPPSFSQSSSAAVAPTGNVPVTPKDQEFEIEFIPYDPAEHPINLTTDDLTLDWEDNGYRIMIKQEDQPHDQGIDGGRISRLALVKDNEPPVYFDYGEWVNPPKSPLECQMVDEIKEDLNATPEKPFKGFSGPDSDHEI
ncbi:MAG: hypothetical protein COB76_00990 [Alphaproteobacteria bacterium]|nr:MAG: hypothetical protein COB76_00990 [Alphaproteobacteria bacterium]